jgi:hypothetical protein
MPLWKRLRSETIRVGTDISSGDVWEAKISIYASSPSGTTRPWSDMQAHSPELGSLTHLAEFQCASTPGGKVTEKPKE